MAFNLNSKLSNNLRNSDTNISSGNYYVDASIVDQIRSDGYILTPTSINARTAISTFKSTTLTLAVGKAIPVFSDGTGNAYVMDEKRVVYLLEKSKVNQTTGIPNNISTPTNTSILTNGNVSTAPSIGNTSYIQDYVKPPNYNLALGSGKIYSQFAIDDIIPNQQEIVTRTLWSGNEGNLTTFFTSSYQNATQKQYYYEIFNSNVSCQSEPQFSVIYGNIKGSGSIDEGGQIEDTPSRAIYNQFRLKCLNSNSTNFVINGKTINHMYGVIVNRARMREYLDEGNIELNLAHLSGSQWVLSHPANAYTGSNVHLAGNGKVLRLIDDSSLNSATVLNSGEVYNIVSGSIEDGIYNSTSPVTYGQLFRRQGIIILDADMLDASASFGTVTGREINGDNAYKLFKSISGSAKYTDGSGDYLGFKGRGAEKVKSTHYFVRVKNQDYNFSNNPSFITGSEGDLRHPGMYNDPKTYITTVGLYNSQKELVAVAKLSKAVMKSFTAEALIKVRLDF